MTVAGWSVGPPLVAAVLLAACHLRGYRSLQRLHRVRTGRVDARRRREATLFGVSLVVLVLALQSPLDGLAERSFSAHMVQHLLLLVVVPPLLVLAAPWTPMARGLPVPARAQVVRAARSRPLRPLWRVLHSLAHPWPAAALLVADLWTWHLPAAYGATLSVPPVHDVEHLLFLGTGLLFWLQLADSRPLRAAPSPVVRSVALLGAAIGGWLLAMVLTFASAPLYADYARLVERPFGLSALADQRIGAAIMWVPGMLPYAIALAVIVYTWLDGEERRGVDRRFARSPVPARLAREV